MNGRNWTNVVVAALAMVGTLPGRTQGLGLVTEPLLGDLGLQRVTYASINFWATLLGALACLPAGWLMDRWGARRLMFFTVAALGGSVLAMTVSYSAVWLALWILASRGLGQSALSVESITLASRSSGSRLAWPMVTYALLIGVLFAVAFVAVGASVRQFGWRAAWSGVGFALLLGLAPLMALIRTVPNAEGAAPAAEEERLIEDVPSNAPAFTLRDALRSPAFWAFGLATAFFALAAAGIGLFNEAILAERGFAVESFHQMLAESTLVGMLAQFAAGGLGRRCSYRSILTSSLIMYAAGLAVTAVLQTAWQLHLAATLLGAAGGTLTVAFFAIWRQSFGTAHLGAIQGAAQLLTVVGSAIGPLAFAATHESSGSYVPALATCASVAIVLAAATWWAPLGSRHCMFRTDLTLDSVNA